MSLTTKTMNVKLHTEVDGPTVSSDYVRIEVTGPEATLDDLSELLGLIGPLDETLRLLRDGAVLSLPF